MVPGGVSRVSAPPGTGPVCQGESGMPSPEKFFELVSESLSSYVSGQQQESGQSEAELAYDAYLASVATFNLVYANHQPMDITIPEWPALVEEPSIQCIAGYILTLGAFIQMATFCIESNYPNEVATQECIDYWHGLLVTAISGCVVSA